MKRDLERSAKTKSEQEQRIHCVNTENFQMKGKVSSMEVSLASAQTEASNALAEIESLKDSLGSNYEQLTDALDEVKASDERCQKMSNSNQTLSIEFEMARSKFDEDRTEFRDVYNKHSHIFMNIYILMSLFSHTKVSVSTHIANFKAWERGNWCW